VGADGSDALESEGTLVLLSELGDKFGAFVSYMFTIQDVNHNFKLDKCEHMYGCLAFTHEEGQTEEEENKKGFKCAKFVTEFRKEHKGAFTL
jgi:hypothetical protein